MQYTLKKKKTIIEMSHAKATGCSTYELCAIVVQMRIHNDCILVCHNNFTSSFIMESMQTRGTVRSIKLLHAEVQCSRPEIHVLSEAEMSGLVTVT